MKRKEKIYYFFDSYWIHIILGIFTLILIGTFFSDDSYEMYDLNGMFIGSTINFEELEKLNDNITEKLNDTEENVNISFSPDNFDGQAKFTLQSATGELDFVVLEKESYDKLKDKEFFLDIRNLMDNGESYYYDDGALLAEESNKIQELDYDSENKVVAVVSTSKNLENVKTFIDYIYEE